MAQSSLDPLAPHPLGALVYFTRNPRRIGIMRGHVKRRAEAAQRFPEALPPEELI